MQVRGGGGSVYFATWQGYVIFKNGTVVPKRFTKIQKGNKHTLHKALGIELLISETNTMF